MKKALNSFYISIITILSNLSLAYSQYNSCEMYRSKFSERDFTCLEQKSENEFFSLFNDLEIYSEKISFFSKMKDFSLQTLDKQIEEGEMILSCYENGMDPNQDLSNFCNQSNNYINKIVKFDAPNIRAALFKASLAVRELSWDSVLHYKDFIGLMYPWPNIMVGKESPRNYTKFELDSMVLPELKKEFTKFLSENFTPSWKDLDVSHEELKSDDIIADPTESCLVDGVTRKVPNNSPSCIKYYNKLSYEINFIFPKFAKELEIKESLNLGLHIQNYPFMAYLNFPPIEISQFKNDQELRSKVNAILGQQKLNLESFESDEILYELLVSLSHYKLDQNKFMDQLINLKGLSKETEDYLKNMNEEQKRKIRDLFLIANKDDIKNIFSGRDVLSSLKKTIAKAKELRAHIDALNPMDESEMLDIIAFDGLAEEILLSFPHFCEVGEQLKIKYQNRNDKTLSEMASVAGTVATCLLSRFRLCFAVGAFSSGNSFFNARNAAEREKSKVHSIFASPLVSTDQDLLLKSMEARIDLNDPLYAMIFTKGSTSALERGAPKIYNKGQSYLKKMWQEYLDGFKDLGVRRLVIKKRDSLPDERGFFGRLNPTNYELSNMVPLVGSFALMDYIPSEEEVVDRVKIFTQKEHQEAELEYLSQYSHLNTLRFIGGKSKNIQLENYLSLTYYEDLISKEIDNQNLDHDQNKIVLNYYDKISKILLSESESDLNDSDKDLRRKIGIPFSSLVKLIQRSNISINEKQKEEIIFNHHSYIRSLGQFIKNDVVSAIINNEKLDYETLPSALKKALKDSWVKENILTHKKKQDRVCYLANYLTYEHHKKAVSIIKKDLTVDKKFFLDLNSPCQIIQKVY